MYIVRSRGGSQAPLGAACCPALPLRKPDMPLLAELKNNLLGQHGYNHAAPNGAEPLAQECEPSRLERACKVGQFGRGL
jgi:hypothetical protein